MGSKSLGGLLGRAARPLTVGLALLLHRYGNELSILVDPDGQAVNQRTLVVVVVPPFQGRWRLAEIGDLDTGAGTQTPGSAMTQAMEIQQLRADIKALLKDNARLKKENDFLEEASAFFAASRQRLAKKSE